MSPKSTRQPLPPPVTSPSTPQLPIPISLTDLFARLFHNSRTHTPPPTIFIPPNATRAQIAAILAVELRNDNTVVSLPIPDAGVAQASAASDDTKATAETANGTSNGNRSPIADESAKVPTSDDPPPASPRLRKGIDYPLDHFDRTPEDERRRREGAVEARCPPPRTLHDHELLASPSLRRETDGDLEIAMELELLGCELGWGLVVR